MTTATQQVRRSVGPPTHSGLRVGVVARVLLGTVSVVLFWAFLAPTALGGSTSYVVTEGTSMLPRMRADGLVITRARDEYEVGEVVAYENPELGAVVLHRIVERRGDRYLFQGDNNDYLDRYEATSSEIVGREWVYWAGAGRQVRLLRNPLTFAVIIGLLALVSMRPPRRRRRTSRHHR